MQQLILGIGNAIQWVIEPFWIKFITKDYLQIYKNISSIYKLIYKWGKYKSFTKAVKNAKLLKMPSCLKC
jgi:hypothetical protein